MTTPKHWKANDAEGTEDNCVFHDDTESMLRREVQQDGSISYSRVDDYGNGIREPLPKQVQLKSELTPEEVAEAFGFLDVYSAPREVAAFTRGRIQGREDVRGIIRDLVGPATAQNVSRELS